MKIEIYIPSVDLFGSKQPMLTAEWKKNTQSKLCSLFGGCTTVEGEGSWINEKGQLVTESVSIVTAYATRNNVKYNQGELRSFCSLLKNVLDQECILLVIDNKHEFI